MWSRMSRKHHSNEAVIMKDRIGLYLKLNSTFAMPIVSRKLERLYNISNRVVREAVGLLRDEGLPIASGSLGFFYATTADQLEPTIDNLKERIAVISRRRALLMQARNKMREDANGQRLLFTNLEN